MCGWGRGFLSIGDHSLIANMLGSSPQCHTRALRRRGDAGVDGRRRSHPRVVFANSRKSTHCDVKNPRTRTSEAAGSLVERHPLNISIGLGRAPETSRVSTRGSNFGQPLRNTRARAHPECCFAQTHKLGAPQAKR